MANSLRNNSTRVNNVKLNSRNNSSNANSGFSASNISSRISNSLSDVSSFFSGKKNNSNLKNNNSTNRMKTNNSSNTGTVKKSNSSGSSSTVIMILVLILFIIILGVGGYYLYKYLNKHNLSNETTKQFIPYIHDASIDKRIASGSIPRSADGNEYNINFWVYVNDYVVRKSQDKCILYRGEAPAGTLNDASVDVASGNPNVNCNPGVWLLKNVNTLRIIVGLETNYGVSNCDTSVTQACESGVQDVDVCDIENFPLQRWVNVNITLRNNVIDVFFDGALKKSTILKGFPMLSNNDMLVCPDGGFNGYISNMKYSNKAVSMSKIENMYKSGPTL